MNNNALQSFASQFAQGIIDVMNSLGTEDDKRCERTITLITKVANCHMICMIHLSGYQTYVRYIMAIYRYPIYLESLTLVCVFFSEEWVASVAGKQLWGIWPLLVAHLKCLRCLLTRSQI